MVQSAWFYHFLVKFEGISKIKWEENEEILLFLPFLKECYQLQTDGISKRFDAQRRDCAQIVNFSTQIKMLINFVCLS